MSHGFKKSQMTPTNDIVPLVTAFVSCVYPRIERLPILQSLRNDNRCMGQWFNCARNRPLWILYPVVDRSIQSFRIEILSPIANLSVWTRHCLKITDRYVRVE